ncbi:MAG: CRISPR-associated endonuclease Cas6 [Candidatus Woesearchaeota archaeon]
MLENILFGNIMLLSKNFGYTIDKQVTVNINKFIKTDIVIKNIEMLGFLGNFTINFEIPDYFGIGKTVSKGFGVIARYNKKHIIMEETDN